MRVVVVMLFLLATAVCSIAAAEQPKVTIDVRDAEAREAICLLFYKSGENFVIDAQVTGKVTAHMVDQPLDVALKAVLSTLDATWRKSDGIYQIVKKTPPPAPVEMRIDYLGDPGNPPGKADKSDEYVLERIPLQFIDGRELVDTLKGDSKLRDHATDHGRTSVVPLPVGPAVPGVYSPQLDTGVKALLPQGVNHVQPYSGNNGVWATK